jgi:hypothetical protein
MRKIEWDFLDRKAREKIEIFKEKGFQCDELCMIAAMFSHEIDVLKKRLTKLERRMAK